MLPEQYWMAEPDAEPRDLMGLASRVHAGDPVIVRGRVRDAPVSRCVLRLVDLSLPPCHEIPESTCTTPWDWCTVDPERLKLASALVVFRDPDGIRRGTVRGFHELGIFSRVIVRGVAAKDRGGGLVIEATALHVLP